MSDQSDRIDESGLPRGYAFKPEYEIAPVEAARLMRDQPGSLLLIDCRTQDEYDLVHIEGSVHIPMHEIEERWPEIDLGQGQRVAVICHHGMRSLRTALALRAFGLSNAVSVAGGIEWWATAVDRGIPRYEHRGGRFVLVQAQNPGGG
jgi:rhodanese-related sulfurtransferase